MKEYATTHIPHGWLKSNANFSGICPTIDACIHFQHTLLIEIGGAEEENYETDDSSTKGQGGYFNGEVSNQMETEVRSQNR